jgi:hypothetical protein
MKNTKIVKSLCAIVGAASVLATTSAFATFSYNGTYSGTLTLSHGYGDAIDVNASGLGTYTSFCLNSGVVAWPATTYNYVSSDTVTPANSGGPANVTLGTAWLYSEFSSGDLSSYGYVYGDANSANQLQQAIWYLQGSPAGVDNAFVVDAQTAVGSGNSTNASGGAYGVFALTLTIGNTYAQPILGIVPEPSTVVAGVLLLLPFGVSTVRILRKDKVS